MTKSLGNTPIPPLAPSKFGGLGLYVYRYASNDALSESEQLFTFWIRFRGDVGQRLPEMTAFEGSLRPSWDPKPGSFRAASPPAWLIPMDFSWISACSAPSIVGKIPLEGLQQVGMISSGQTEGPMKLLWTLSQGQGRVRPRIGIEESRHLCPNPMQRHIKIMDLAWRTRSREVPTLLR